MQSIFDVFRNVMNPGNRQSQSMDPNMNPNLNPALQNPNTQQQQQNNPLPNPQVVQNNNDPAKPPEDPFKDLWTIDPKQTGPADLSQFAFTFDPATVDRSINGLDFTKAITPELAAKIAGGGPEAVTAMMAAMNIVGQQAAKTALLASTKITETGIRTSGQRIKDNLPSLVRNEAVSSALREDNPLFNNPATAPMMELVTQQLAQKFPNATPQELRDSAKQYMVNFAESAAKFGGKQISNLPSPSEVGRAQQTDWSQEPV